MYFLEGFSNARIIGEYQLRFMPESNMTIQIILEDTRGYLDEDDRLVEGFQQSFFL